MSTRTPRRALLAALFAATPTGSFYGFALYAQALKTQFGLTQRQLDNINTVPYLLGVFGVANGMLAKKLGPRLALAIGGGMVGAMQLLMYWLARRPEQTPRPSITLVGVACAQYVFGMSIVASVAFSTPVIHFQHQRGLATALVKSFVGLGGAAVAQLFEITHPPIKTLPPAAALDALVLWAGVVWGSTAVAVALMPAARDAAAAEPTLLLRILFPLLLVLGFLLIAISLMPHGSLHETLTPFVLSLSLLPIPLALYPDIRQFVLSIVRRDTHSRASSGSSPAVLSPPLPNAGEPPPPPAAAMTAAADDELGEVAEEVLETPVAFTTVEMVRTPDAWFLWFCATTLIGTGMLIATNLSQIVQAARASTQLVPALSTLFSAGNMIGRLVSMAGSDAIVRAGHSRCWFVAAITATMGASLAGMLGAAMAAADSAGQQLLFVLSSSASGLAFGAIWPHMV